MKKMLIIIGVLAIIFVGMAIYKNNNNKNAVTIKEVENIEKYISKIYMWKEITNESLPEFDNINNANDLWIWEVIKKNLEEYEISYEDIEFKAKELFGQSFNKEFPKEGIETLKYDEETDKYLATEVNLDAMEDMFLLENIQKNKKGYNVEIVEYLEDYSSEGSVVVRNTNGEEVGRISNIDNETEIKSIVKNNIDKFSRKQVYLIKEQENIIVERVEAK